MSDFPYPGLRPFQRDEIDIFFGRESHLDQLIKRLRQTHFLAVVGLSGCGKSSLIRTGLWSDLETGFLARAGARWQVAELRPGDRPFASLAKALLKTDWGPNYLSQLENRDEAAAFLQAQLRRVSLVGIHGILQETPLPADTNLLLFIDQFEEIFRYYQQSDAEEAEAFVAFLLASSQPSPPPRFSEERHRVYVVITMRSDFLGNCALFAGLSEAINDGQFLVPRLTREQLREAIEFPARVFGGEIEATLVNQLLNDAGTDFDQLPLLQHALMQMWKFARVDNPAQIIVTLKHYDQIGGLANALSQHADKVYARLNLDQQKIAEILFRSLCEYGSDNRDTRRPVKLAEVATLAKVPGEEVVAVVEEFRKPGRSFLMPPVGKELEPESVLDISHESLIRKWRRLKHWAQEEAESAKLYRRLEDSAVRWEQGKAALWHSPDLEIAVAWREKNQPTAQWAKRYGKEFDLAMQFLEKSEKERRRGQLERELARQRLLKLKQVRRQAIWAVVGMIGAIMLAGWGLWQRSMLLQLEKDNRFESQLSWATLLARGEDYAAAKKFLNESRQLDQDISDTSRRHARDLLTRFSDIMRGAPQPLEYKVEDTPLYSVAVSPDGRLLAVGGGKGKLVLFDLHTGKLLQSLIGHNTQAVSTIVFHPEGKWLASAARDKSIIFWSMPSGKKQAEWSAPDKVRALAISPNCKCLASGGEDGNIILWEVGEVGTTGKRRLTFEKWHTENISDDGLAFDSTGKRLASASADKTAGVWNVETGKLWYTLKGHTNMVERVAFSPEDKLLATASSDNSVRLWEVDSGKPFKPSPWLTGHRNTVSSLSFVNEHRLISAGGDRTLRLWDTDSGVTLRIWQGHTAAVNSLVTSGGLVFSASLDGTVKRWDSTLLYQHIMDFPDKNTLKNGPTSVAIAPNGKLVAVGFGDGLLRLYSLPDFKYVEEQKNHRKLIRHMAFNAKGTLLASAGYDSAKLWQVNNGSLREPQDLITNKKTYDVAFSPNAPILAVASEGGSIDLFSVDTKQKLPPTISEGGVQAIAFDSSGTRLLSGGEDGYTQLWAFNPEPPALTGLRKFPEKLPGIVMGTTVSPDEQWIASVGRVFLVHLYALNDNLLPSYFLEGHEQAIYRAFFSPDSKQLVTASSDATVKIWDLPQNKELLTLRLPTIREDYPLFDFDFRCTPQSCWIVVPLTHGKLVGYELGKIYD